MDHSLGTGPGAARLTEPSRRTKRPPRARKRSLIGAPSPVDLSVLSTVHDVGDARLRRLCDALARQGLRVHLVACGDATASPSSVSSISVAPRRSHAGRLVGALLAPARTPGRILVVVDPELVAPALFWSRLRRRRLVVDVHEDYVAVARDRVWARGPLGAMARAAARWTCILSARADLTLVADAHLPPLRARHRLVVRNLPQPGELPPAGTPSEQPRALYVGDLRPSRGLWTMLEAIAAAPGWRLDLVGGLSEVSEKGLDRRLETLGVAERVRWHGRLPLPDAWSLAEGAWCGLALLDETPAYRAAVPTKVHEYLAVGLPVLATPLPRVADLLRRTDGGRLVAGAAEAGAMLRHWSAHPDALHALRRTADEVRAADPARPSAFDAAAAEVRGLLQLPRGPR